jgi:hypothetical protein
MKELVGGWLECIRLDPPQHDEDGLDCWLNESGMIDGLPLNWVIPAAPRIAPPGFENAVVIKVDPELADYGQPGEWRLHGDFFFARNDGEGEIASVTDADVKWAEQVWERMRAPAVEAALRAALDQVNTAIDRVEALIANGKCQPDPFGCGRDGVTMDSFRDDSSRREYRQLWRSLSMSGALFASQCLGCGSTRWRRCAA